MHESTYCTVKLVRHLALCLKLKACVATQTYALMNFLKIKNISLHFFFEFFCLSKNLHSVVRNVDIFTWCQNSICTNVITTRMSLVFYTKSHSRYHDDKSHFKCTFSVLFGCTWTLSSAPPRKISLISSHLALKGVKAEINYANWDIPTVVWPWRNIFLANSCLFCTSNHNHIGHT